MPDLEHDPDFDGPPPFLRTWPNIYRAVLGYLAVLLAALYLVTRSFQY